MWVKERGSRYSLTASFLYITLVLGIAIAESNIAPQRTALHPGCRAPCSPSGSSNSNGSGSSSQHPSPRGAGTSTSSRARASTFSGLRVAGRVGGGWLGSLPSPSIPSWRCGRCAMRCAGPAPGSTGCHPLRLHRPTASRAVLAGDRASRHRDLQEGPKPRRGPLHQAEAEAFVKWHEASSPGPRPPGAAASNSTARRR